MQWKTAISTVNDGDEMVRGYHLHELMVTKSFSDVIFLTLRGVLPTEQEARMFSVILNSMIDHGPGTVSAVVARTTVSAGTDMYAAVAAGLMALGGSRHGGALGGAAQFFVENHNVVDMLGLLKQLKEKKIRVPGFGHAILTHDKRADALFVVARETGFYGTYSAFAEQVRDTLNSISSKPLPLNMDGTNAAILLDMGFDVALISGLFMVSRVTGLLAQVLEETKSGEGLRRVPEEEIEYVGVTNKKV